MDAATNAKQQYALPILGTAQTKLQVRYLLQGAAQ